MTPMHLTRLLEICCSSAQESCPHVMKKTGTMTPLLDLETWGLIERDPSEPPDDFEPTGWVATEKGRAHVDTLGRVPMPTLQWVGPL